MSTTPQQAPTSAPATSISNAPVSAAQRLVGDIAPKLAELTDDVLFGDVWARPQLARRDRSLITVATLVAGGSTEQLVGHLRIAKDNGLSESELVEAITHLAFYAGWPRAMSAITVAKRVFAADHQHADHQHADQQHADHQHADHQHADHQHADHQSSGEAR